MSFTKSEWKVSDYPIRLREQEPLGPAVPRWCARIVNWWVAVGLGSTKEEALADLDKRILTLKEHLGYLPRPGTIVPLQFPARPGIDAHAATAAEFLEKVLGYGADEPVFITDDSSLYDFEESHEGTNLTEKVTQVFGIDISDIKDGNLVRIFERIDANR